MNEADRRALLDLARRAIDAHLRGDRPPEPPAESFWATPAGVFVSLHDRDALRGCIGQVEPIHPLGRILVRCAVSGATEDPRFPPVTLAELPRLALELSILGPLEAVRGADDVIVGRHGLMIQSGHRRGLLLPQVAVEWSWDRETFLAHTCRKAGLAADAWRTCDRLCRFEAEVFGEERLEQG